MKDDYTNELMNALTKGDLIEKANALQEKMDKEGLSLKEASGITDDIENELYVLGKYYYDQGSYKHAKTIFLVLNNIRPNKYSYVFALASAYHQLKDYINASLGFYTALTLEPTDPMNAYYLADCFICLEAYKDADRFLDIVISIYETSKKEEYKHLAERCRLIKSSIKGRKTLDEKDDTVKKKKKVKTKKKS